MGLVDYSDSSESEAEPASKRRKLETQQTNVLPPLPAQFRDLYSSTVRTSTRDDPALHGGRKRVTPHVAGNWPTHVYLDWTPRPEEYSALQQLISHTQKPPNQDAVHSLLENDLGVRQPLHVSLSRPLSLQTDDKDVFLEQMIKRSASSGISAFAVQPLDLVWHPNEQGTRWFLVLRLQRPAGDELRSLLEMCNSVANEFSQPLLYSDEPKLSKTSTNDAHDSFHISIAWTTQLNQADATSGPVAVDLPNTLLQPVTTESINFAEIKVRIGQDVNCIPLQQARKR
ncbi:hypothetical protein CKM354_000702400 [Cercospora kikuchii]|uniref:U6 snRNA phosphodiesterase n=1 Tax=Cercospora kikuchii TaxID=84275 RepID=A0A9P3CJC8_9PEZI|nr:uncharacterized protein CKM354_000702400 [Cercospora kikuchii]GIZ43811.1 hypothetical protein CKM354_000702400 [Cercospora kikuchii]